MVPASARPSRAARVVSRTIQVELAAAVLLGASPEEMVTLPLYGVAILAAPPAVGRACGRRFGPCLRLWVSAGLAIHPIGALYDLYHAVPWWDHLAHAASASLVAGLGYLLAAASAGADREGDLPAAVHAVVLAAVLAGGVAWELFELQVSYLTVYGPVDTAADLAYDAVGWLLVAPRWRSLLGDRPRRLADRLAALAGDGRGPRAAG